MSSCFPQIIKIKALIEKINSSTRKTSDEKYPDVSNKSNYISSFICISYLFSGKLNPGKQLLGFYTILTNYHYKNEIKLWVTLNINLDS